jgi:hypothetical protein
MKKEEKVKMRKNMVQGLIAVKIAMLYERIQFSYTPPHNSKKITH